MSRGSTYRPRTVSEGDLLTARELEILALVAAGKPTAAIAELLGITENTVKTHLTSVYRKTGSHNRVQAAGYYFREHGDGAARP